MVPVTIGMDLGDKYSQVCILEGDRAPRVRRVPTKTAAIAGFLSDFTSTVTVIIEAGTHSRWVSHLIKQSGHSVYVANPRNLRLLTHSHRKSDATDAELLARIGRADPKLLSPIQHRSMDAHADLLVIRARDTLVRQRTKTVNAVRGMTKTFGVSLPRCSPATFPEKVVEIIPESLQPALAPLLKVIEGLTKLIRRYDRKIVGFVEFYPELAPLTELPGVGPITAAAFLLTIEDPKRFKNSRAVGAYIGLTPRQHQSGEKDPQLRITKRGNSYLRRLLVLSAHKILQKRSADCDLKTVGLAIAARGGKNAKKRAVVALARRLAVLMHVLWRRGEVYDPHHRDKLSAVRATA
jgi:transposase